MKKYFSGIIAIVLAVGFSAFTPQKMERSEKMLNGYFWYTVQSNGTIDQLVDPSQVTKSTALGFTDCNDQTSITCLIGSGSSSLQQGDPAPAVNQPSRDNQITEHMQ